MVCDNFERRRAMKGLGVTSREGKKSPIAMDDRQLLEYLLERERQMTMEIETPKRVSSR